MSATIAYNERYALRFEAVFDMYNAKDLQKAKNNLAGHTLALCKDEILFLSDKRGILPMVEYIDDNADLRGFCAADTIVGKAVASMFVKSGILAVYANVMSKTAFDYLKSHGIYAEYTTLVDVIVNRQGTGSCPMEEAVKDLQNPDECFVALKNKLAFLRSQHANKKNA